MRPDRLTTASLGFLCFVVIAAFGGLPLASHLLGHGPDDPFSPGGVDPTTNLPVGPWQHFADPISGHKTLLILGGADSLGRDEFLRLLAGAQTSFEVGVGAAALSVLLGFGLGALAGYFGGAIDALISGLTELTMIFPQLLVVILVGATVGSQIDHVTLGFLPPGVVRLVLLLGLLSWFYPARIVRSHVLTLREREFVEAARMIGASELRILRTHILPFLTAPLLAYGAVLVSLDILAEAGLSYLGYGINVPTASWGTLLTEGTQYYEGEPGLVFKTEPLLILWPAIAIALTSLAFNFLADGLRGSKT